MAEKFTFDDETRGVLEQKKKRTGRPKNDKPTKNKCINCYLSEDEFEQFIIFLDGRPASAYLRSLVMDAIETKT